jgi:type II secretory pathway component PulM
MEDEKRLLVTAISQCSPDVVQAHVNFAPEPMDEDMKRAIRNSMLADRLEMVGRALIYARTMVVRGDIAIASVVLGALTNHWEITMVGYGM